MIMGVLTAVDIAHMHMSIVVRRDGFECVSSRVKVIGPSSAWRQNLPIVERTMFKGVVPA